ncbi:MAG TPA: DNA translocase FtsK [Patescibacteria group bacterium]|nr:DNA translocase FtsK [Patescibacteria group bacterium]
MARGRRKKPFKLNLKKDTLYTISSVFLFSLAAIIVFSFSRQGTLLTKLFQVFIYYFGWGAVLLPFLLMTAGLMMARLRWRITRPNVFVGSVVLAIALISLTRTGLIGSQIWYQLAGLISAFGAFFVLMGFVFIGFVVVFNTSLEEIVLFLMKFITRIRQLSAGLKKVSSRRQLATGDLEIRSGGSKEAVKSESQKREEELTSSLVTNLPAEEGVWEFPPLSLLADSVSGKADRGDIKKNADLIEKTLESFGVAARVAEVNLGPAVTQYALEIALGTKLSKITTLANDLALALAAPTGQIRIEAPIPGRSLVGIEVPNRSPEFVTLKKMLTSDQMEKAKSRLTIPLGLNVSGDSVVDNINRMPHVLIAGATGSGKSVCINSFIAAILFRASPAEVKFILVDPKRVELTQYNGIPHLLTPVIVDPEKVISALKWAISEMERRYKLFAEVGVRNIDAYNELSGFSALPYILIIIDELADIMLFAPAEVEDVICRIAQMARATGIHLIISTQRPSVDVITGLIKANIPCRIAFNVSSQVDSRVIIDMPGAEKLLGRGDMLYIPPDQAKPTRIQGTLVSEPEIQKLIGFLKKAGVAPQYTEEVTKMPTKAGTVIGGEIQERDELFDDAVRTVCRYERASASLLQRRLKVGYARAARIIDQLERVGIVGSAEGSKPREVLIKDPEEYLASQVVSQQ